MIQRIKNWFSNYRNYREKRRRKQTLKIIKKAKQAYLDGRSVYMCICFELVEKTFNCYNDVIQRIPEMRKSTFGLYEPEDIWWDWRGCK